MTKRKPQYLLIGNGRVARHFSHYFTLSGITFKTWNRSQSVSILDEYLIEATHVLLLISDNALQSFADQYLKTHQSWLIHFSGAFISKDVIGAHPLQTFSHDLYNLEDYQKVPFILDDDAPAFAEIFPDLNNPHVRLAKQHKAKYHAMCVLSGNFSCMLWQKFFSTLESEFNISKSIAFPYMQQQMQNLMVDSASALTGPLVRGDQVTIDKNLIALEGDAYKRVYESFIGAWHDHTKLSR